MAYKGKQPLAKVAPKHPFAKPQISFVPKRSGDSAKKSSPTPRVPQLTTAEDLLAVANTGRRVCPQPMYWNDLYKMLPGTRQVGLGWEPPLPLILAAWWEAGDGLKRERFHEHLQWAAAHGASARVHAFLVKLTEEQWHHERE